MNGCLDSSANPTPTQKNLRVKDMMMTMIFLPYQKKRSAHEYDVSSCSAEGPRFPHSFLSPQNETATMMRMVLTTWRWSNSKLHTALLLGSSLPLLWNLVLLMQHNLLPAQATSNAVAGTAPTAFLYRHKRSKQPPLSFTTSLEWLAEEKIRNGDDIDYQKGITWADPSSQKSFLEQEQLQQQAENSVPDDDGDDWILPLYPLDATYLPAGTNHTLNNVEPRNIQMALDLLQDEPITEGRRFCAVLRAVDTGRIATVGTVLQILDANIQYNGETAATSVAGDQQESRSGITRIQLTCSTCPIEPLVEIVKIENPQAASRESRLRRLPEYLRARVRPLQKETKDSCISTNNLINTSSQVMVQQLSRDWDSIQTMYSLGIGSQYVLPPNLLPNLAQAMPKWSSIVSSSRSKMSNNDDGGLSNFQFWNMAEAWQSVCCTIREGHHQHWTAERNEQMVTAAMAAGGPLKLPVHMEDLSVEMRKKLQRLEVEAQETFWQRGLDPCLDFHLLLTLPKLDDRIALLAEMVARERSKLEVMARDYTSSDTMEKFYDDEDDDETRNLPPQKGAWFE